MTKYRIQDGIEQREWERALGVGPIAAARPHRASAKPRTPRCKGCNTPLLDATDIRMGHCRNCYRPHSSPSCSGFCAAAPPFHQRYAANRAKPAAVAPVTTSFDSMDVDLDEWSEEN